MTTPRARRAGNVPAERAYVPRPLKGARRAPGALSTVAGGTLGRYDGAHFASSRTPPRNAEQQVHAPTDRAAQAEDVISCRALHESPRPRQKVPGGGPDGSRGLRVVPRAEDSGTTIYRMEG